MQYWSSDRPSGLECHVQVDDQPTSSKLDSCASGAFNVSELFLKLMLILKDNFRDLKYFENYKKSCETKEMPPSFLENIISFVLLL